MKGFVKMTENNYVIKEDPSKAGLMLGQRLYTALSLAVTHSGEGPQQRRDIDIGGWQT